MDYQFSTQEWEPEGASVPQEPVDTQRESPRATPAEVLSVAKKGAMSIYGLDLGWYIQLIRKPVIYGSVLVVSAVVLTFALPGQWADGADALSFIIKLIMWGVIGWHGARVAQRAGAAAVAAGMAGLAVGFALGMLRLLVVREVWTLFNLIVEPVVSGVFGYLIGGAVALAVRPLSRPVPRYLP